MFGAADAEGDACKSAVQEVRRRQNLRLWDEGAVHAFLLLLLLLLLLLVLQLLLQLLLLLL